LVVQTDAPSPEKVHTPDKNCGSQKRITILRSCASKSELAHGFLSLSVKRIEQEINRLTLLGIVAVSLRQLADLAH
jgi:hypothetical protein